MRAAREVQAARWRDLPYRLNAQIPGSVLREGPWRLPASVRAPLDRAMDLGQLTLRGLDRALRVAWTVADLQGQARPRRSDVEHALRLRTPEAVRVA